MSVIFDVPRSSRQLDSGLSHFDFENDAVGPDPPFMGRDYVAPVINPYAQRALSIFDRPVLQGQERVFQDREIDRKTDPCAYARARGEQSVQQFRARLQPDGVTAISDDKRLLWFDFLCSDANKRSLATFAAKMIPRGNETKTVARSLKAVTQKRASCALVKLETPLDQHLVGRSNPGVSTRTPAPKRMEILDGVLPEDQSRIPRAGASITTNRRKETQADSEFGDELQGQQHASVRKTSKRQDQSSDRSKTSELQSANHGYIAPIASKRQFGVDGFFSEDIFSQITKPFFGGYTKKPARPKQDFTEAETRLEMDQEVRVKQTLTKHLSARRLDLPSLESGKSENTVPVKQHHPPWPSADKLTPVDDSAEVREDFVGGYNAPPTVTRSAARPTGVADGSQLREVFVDKVNRAPIVTVGRGDFDRVRDGTSQEEVLTTISNRAQIQLGDRSDLERVTDGAEPHEVHIRSDNQTQIVLGGRGELEHVDDRASQREVSVGACNMTRVTLGNRVSLQMVSDAEVPRGISVANAPSRKTIRSDRPQLEVVEDFESAKFGSEDLGKASKARDPKVALGPVGTLERVQDQDAVFDERVTRGNVVGIRNRGSEVTAVEDGIRHRDVEPKVREKKKVTFSLGAEKRPTAEQDEEGDGRAERLQTPRSKQVQVGANDLLPPLLERETGDRGQTQKTRAVQIHLQRDNLLPVSDMFEFGQSEYAKERQPLAIAFGHARPDQLLDQVAANEVNVGQRMQPKTMTGPGSRISTTPNPSEGAPSYDARIHAVPIQLARRTQVASRETLPYTDVGRTNRQGIVSVAPKTQMEFDSRADGFETTTAPKHLVTRVDARPKSTFDNIEISKDLLNRGGVGFHSVTGAGLREATMADRAEEDFATEHGHVGKPMGAAGRHRTQQVDRPEGEVLFKVSARDFPKVSELSTARRVVTQEFRFGANEFSNFLAKPLR